MGMAHKSCGWVTNQNGMRGMRGMRAYSTKFNAGMLTRRNGMYGMRAGTRVHLAVRQPHRDRGHLGANWGRCGKRQLLTVQTYRALSALRF